MYLFLVRAVHVLILVRKTLVFEFLFFFGILYARVRSPLHVVFLCMDLLSLMKKFGKRELNFSTSEYATRNQVPPVAASIYVLTSFRVFGSFFVQSSKNPESVAIPVPERRHSGNSPEN